jgi:hypothetical protein
MITLRPSLPPSLACLWSPQDKPAESPEYLAYLAQLAKHHAVMKAAMKAKQTVDPAAADKLDDALHTVSHLYDVKH